MVTATSCQAVHAPRQVEPLICEEDVCPKEEKVLKKDMAPNEQSDMNPTKKPTKNDPKTTPPDFCRKNHDATSDKSMEIMEF